MVINIIYSSAGMQTSLPIRLPKHSEDDHYGDNEGIPLRRQESLRTPWYILCIILCNSGILLSLGRESVKVIVYFTMNLPPPSSYSFSDTVGCGRMRLSCQCSFGFLMIDVALYTSLHSIQKTESNVIFCTLIIYSHPC